ncbi:hypothetical protein, partial [Escherichia coli]|uniref:hypothetical protein n=1 Tax=Escherichia coli TaxID=562 RepID=UPI001F4A88F2
PAKKIELTKMATGNTPTFKMRYLTQFKGKKALLELETVTSGKLALFSPKTTRSPSPKSTLPPQPTRRALKSVRCGFRSNVYMPSEKAAFFIQPKSRK